MAVVARFVCNERREFTFGSKVILRPVSGEEEVNKVWASATPSGLLEMDVNNELASEQFQVGETYELLLTRVVGPDAG